MMEKKTDILIVGSGPAGLSAAVYGIRANRSVIVAEKDWMGIGQIAESAEVDNYLGMPSASGYDLGTAFRSHAESAGAVFITGKVSAIRQVDGEWEAKISDGEAEKVRAKAVIYCGGAQHRQLGAPGEERLRGMGISYCAICDGAFFKDEDVVVVGGGDTALGDALYLSSLCRSVSIIHRRDKFRGSGGTVQRLREKGNVNFLAPAQVAEFLGEKRLSGVRLKDGRSIQATGAFIAVGMNPNTDLIKDYVRLDEGGYVIADESGMTGEAGLYVAGDIRTKRLRQVITAAADGAVAATCAVEYIEGL